MGETMTYGGLRGGHLLRGARVWGACLSAGRNGGLEETGSIVSQAGALCPFE